MVFRCPVAQSIQNHVPHDRVVAVQGVSGSTEVEIIPILGQGIVGCVIDAAEGDRGAKFVAFGGVVENHIQDDLDPILMQLFDHGFQLIRNHGAIPGSTGGGIPRLGGKETHRAVSPIIQLLPLIPESGLSYRFRTRRIRRLEAIQRS